MHRRNGLFGVLALALALPAAAQERSVELRGVVLLNGFYTDDAVDNLDVPLFVVPVDPFQPEVGAGGGTLRQTWLGLEAEWQDVLRGRLTAEVEVDFYGGHATAGRTSPRARLRRTRAELNWPNGWVLVGQDAPPIAGLNPSTMAAVGVPGFTFAGNLSRWIPQVRLGAAAGRRVRVGIEGAVLAPQGEESVGDVNTSPDRAERTERPFMQGRLLAAWGDRRTGARVSAGGHYGWLFNAFDSLVVTKAAAGTVQLFLGGYLEIRGEGFVGEGLGVLGGGGIGQTLSPSGIPVRTKGAWGQLNLTPLPELELGGGYGLDDPDDADVSPLAGKAKNVAWETHVIWRPEPLVVAVEYRRLETTYVDALLRLLNANHVNVALGVAF